MADHDGEPDDAHVPRGGIVHERVARQGDAPDLSLRGITGRGSARLQPGAGCDFPSAQVQAERILVEFVGRRDGDELQLRFRDVERMPAGSQDLGAFAKTLETLRVGIVERPGSEITKQTRIEDPEDEIYRSVTTIRLGA